MRPICAKCQRFYRCKKNGVYFTETMETEDRGTVPYKMWSGDLWWCPDCHAEIIVGAGREPVAEHYEPDFAEHAARCGGDKLLIKG